MYVCNVYVRTNVCMYYVCKCVCIYHFPVDDDIRQDEGFKNVSLGNVLSAAAQDKRVSFLAQEEQVWSVYYNQ